MRCALYRCATSAAHLWSDHVTLLDLSQINESVKSAVSKLTLLPLCRKIDFETPELESNLFIVIVHFGSTSGPPFNFDF